MTAPRAASSTASSTRSGATPARVAALAALSERRRRNARMRDLLRSSSALATLSERDRAQACRLALGCVAAQGELDRVIDAHLSPGVHLEPRVRDALELASFELLYLSTPDAVCVSQGVELVRSVSPQAAGLANAVLHRIAEKDVAELAAAQMRVDAGTGDASDMARVGGLPEWLCERALASLGRDRALAWARGALEPSCASVAVNRAVYTSAEAEQLLVAAGCEPESGPLVGSFVLGHPSSLAKSGLVEDVVVLPCDLAAQEVVLATAPKPRARVLEVGQGRGTKTILLEGASVASGGPCEIVAVEIDANKSALASRRMEAAGIAEHVCCCVADGRELGESRGQGLPSEPAEPIVPAGHLEPAIQPALAGTFDVLFVDAPCSGTGTTRRHPELAWSLTPENTSSCVHLELELLHAASACLAPEGVLIYSTCSLLVEEDEEVVDAFLLSPEGEAFVCERAERTTQGSDIHFYARLRRREL